MSSTRIIETPVGFLRLVSGPRGLVECSFVPVCESGHETPPDPLLNHANAQLSAYFSGTLQYFDLPLDLSRLSTFSRRVVEELRKIPYGTTVTYAELAALAGSPRAARAVGRVMASNRLPLIVPCHRVVGAHGAMTGYSGGEGISTKQWLLQHERRS